MSKLFSTVSVRKPKRTVFDLSYSNKLSLDFGRLCPMLLEKVIPSDKFYIRDEFMARFAPFFGQVFQAINLRTEYFFVPSRLLWKNFEMFLTQGLDGKSDYVHPYIDMKLIWKWCEDNNYSLQGTLFDYFNIATQQVDYDNIGEDVHIDALPFFAYCKAFLDYYADENLDYMPLLALFESGLEWCKDGDNTVRLTYLLRAINDAAGVSDWNVWKNNYLNASRIYDGFNVFIPALRSYPKDYFTSALPFAQRGPIVTIPINGEGDVTVSGPQGLPRMNYQGVGARYNADGTVTLFPDGELVIGSDASAPEVNNPEVYDQGRALLPHLSGTPAQVSQSAINSAVHNSITFRAVNVNGTATITDLRTAVTVQNWLEKRARCGSRPKEQLFASFAVKSKDYRLDRTEFIGRFASTVKIGEVFTTAQNDDDTFVPGLGVSVGQLADGSKRFKKFVPEHGYIIGNISFFPKASYFQGIPRHFLELDCLDYPWPEFQHVGEQDVKNIELYIDDEGNSNFDSFGYQMRYAHYKSRTDQIHGDFRGSLEYMVAARKFNSSPHLNNKFIQVNVLDNDLYRIFNATGEWENASPCYIDIYHHVKAVRPLTYYGNPRLI